MAGSLSAWSWFSICVEKVGVAPSGFGARAVRKRSLEYHGFRRTASLRTTSNRTTSRGTTSARKTSRLELIEQSFGERFLENSSPQTAGLGEQLLREQLLTNGSHELRIPSLRKPSPSSLRARTCTFRKGSLPRLCGERVLLRVIDTLRLIGVGLPSTNQVQSKYTRSIMEHASQRV